MAKDWPRTKSTALELSPEATSGAVHAESLSADSAEKTAELLALNDASYHVKWGTDFHNHIVHHILNAWALGATPAQLQAAYDHNTWYQEPLVHKAKTESGMNLKDAATFGKYLGKDEYYDEYLAFFKREISEHGTLDVLQDYLFNGSEKADNLLCRLPADLEHPLIHLGCGLEFKQPVIVAEALAAACVHPDWAKGFLLPTEEYLRAHKDVSSKSLLRVIEDMLKDPRIVVEATDGFDKVRDGLLTRISGEELAPFLAGFHVKPEPEQIHAKMAEMVQTSVYLTAAAQQPDKKERFDFVTLHCATAAAYFPAIMAEDWLSDQQKARLVELKGWFDAAVYIGVGSPTLYPERILNYKPLHPSDGWPELFHRSVAYLDDGHTAKLIRAIYAAYILPDPAPDFPIKKADFITIAHMCLDAVEHAFGPEGTKIPEQVKEQTANGIGYGGINIVNNMMRWVFHAGLPDSWAFVPGLKSGSGQEQSAH